MIDQAHSKNRRGKNSISP